MPANASSSFVASTTGTTTTDEAAMAPKVAGTAPGCVSTTTESHPTPLPTSPTRPPCPRVLADSPRSPGDSEQDPACVPPSTAQAYSNAPVRLATELGAGARVDTPTDGWPPRIPV